MKDELFKDKTLEGKPFVFDQRVAAVFDDMVSRSVPGYQTIQLLIADLTARFSKEGGVVYDIGCSTGSTFLSIESRINHSITCVGVDNSKEMIERCENRVKGLTKVKPVLEVKDLNAPGLFCHGKAQVIILNLTLQFVPLHFREGFLRRCFDNLLDGGCILLVEKTIEADPKLNDLFIDYYHTFKQEMGYSAMEIAAKRDALENVLIPVTLEENLSMLREAGFSHTASFFRWFNFCGMIGTK